jgi:hypothetical protein
MAKESAVVEAIRVALTAMGGKTVKMHGSPFTVKGTPDVFACVGGRFVAVEAKDPDDGVVSDAQYRQIQLWREAGARVGIATCAADARMIALGKPTEPCPNCERTTFMEVWPDDQIGLGWAYVHCTSCNMGMPIKELDVFRMRLRAPKSN